MDSWFVQERARAAALGYSDPTNPSFEATTEMYHRTLTECLRRIKDLKDRSEDAKKIAIMVASHNENTVRFAIEKYAFCVLVFSWHSMGSSQFHSDIFEYNSVLQDEGDWNLTRGQGDLFWTVAWDV
jgi:hypothetical protein